MVKRIAFSCLFLASVLFQASASTGDQWAKITGNYQLWVGGDWKDTVKDTIVYNDKGLVADSTVFFWNSTANKYVFEQKYSYLHDEFKDMAQSTICTWKKDAGAWDTVSARRHLRVRDSAKNVLELTSQDWRKDQTPRWFNTQKNVNTYNASNKVRTETICMWDAGVGDWRNLTYIVNKYESNNCVEKVIDIWSSADNNWIKSERRGYTYTTDNLLAADSTEKWDATQGGTGGYAKSERVLYSYYSADKRLFTKITQSWAKGKGIFVNGLKASFTYTPAGKTETEHTQRWTVDPSDNGLWLSTIKFTNTYTGKNQIFTRLYEYYDSATAKWNKINENDWAYNSDDNLFTYTFMTWDTTEKKFVNVSKYTLTHAKITVDIAHGTIQGDFAGPFSVKQVSNGILLNGMAQNSTIALFTLNGKLLSKMTINQKAFNLTAHLNRYPAGNYLMKINSGNYSKTFALRTIK